jgi:hypothetical protein
LEVDGQLLEVDRKVEQALLEMALFTAAFFGQTLDARPGHQVVGGVIANGQEHEQSGALGPGVLPDELHGADAHEGSLGPKF